MSIETQLRDALVAHASSIDPAETHPYERVSAAVGRNRTRRRAAGAAAVAAIAAIAIGVPAVSSHLADGRTTPAGTSTTLPPATDKAWNSVTTWPTRGALAGNTSLVDAVQDKFKGRAVFVEDVDTARVAFIVRKDQLIVASGPRGAAGQALTQSSQITAPNIREDSVLSVGAGSSLVILTTPDRTSAEVSGTPDIALDGTVTRTWTRLPLDGGIGRAALSPLTRFRLGSFVGPVQFPLMQHTESTSPGPCTVDCQVSQATQESDTTAHIARTLDQDPAKIETTTVFNGEIPPDSTSGSTTEGTPPASLLVMHSRLPGGQIIRTAVFRSGDGLRSIDSVRPIDARRAAAVPFVINATGDDTLGPTRVSVFVASGTGLRAASDGDTSAVIPISGQLAIFTLPIPPGDFWSYRLEVLDRGTSLGTFPVTHILEDPFEVGP